eukprot:gene14609-4316_t
MKTGNPTSQGKQALNLNQEEDDQEEDENEKSIEELPEEIVKSWAYLPPHPDLPSSDPRVAETQIANALTKVIAENQKDHQRSVRMAKRQNMKPPTLVKPAWQNFSQITDIGSMLKDCAKAENIENVVVRFVTKDTNSITPQNLEAATEALHDISESTAVVALGLGRTMLEQVATMFILTQREVQ